MALWLNSHASRLFVQPPDVLCKRGLLCKANRGPWASALSAYGTRSQRPLGCSTWQRGATMRVRRGLAIANSR
jgi:hypothetical protein